MIMGVDLDDTLIRFHEVLIAFWNAEFGTTFTMEHFTRPDINRVWGVSPKELMRRIRLFNDSPVNQHLLPMKGAQDAAQRLARKHSLHLITNRPVEIRDETTVLVTKLFPGIFSGMHFCTKDWGVTKVRDKSLVCTDVGATTIFEDHLGNAERCGTLGIDVYIMEQPWNKHELPPLRGTVIRVSSWLDKTLEPLFS